MAPAFIFIDPFSFRLPTDKLAELLARSRCEMVINFMWRYVDMALHNPSQAGNMDALFGDGQWEDLVQIQQVDARCDAAIAKIVGRLQAKHYLSMKMLSDRNVIKYVLLHVANHPKARQVMKEVLVVVLMEV